MPQIDDPIDEIEGIPQRPRSKVPWEHVICPQCNSDHPEFCDCHRSVPPGFTTIFTGIACLIIALLLIWSLVS